jgi:hypothetical protein
MSGC